MSPQDHRTTIVAGPRIGEHTWTALRLAAEQMAAQRTAPREPEDEASLARTLVRATPIRSIAPPPFPRPDSPWSDPDRSTLKSATHPHNWRGAALLLTAALFTGLAAGTIAVHLRDLPNRHVHGKPSTSGV